MHIPRHILTPLQLISLRPVLYILELYKRVFRHLDSRLCVEITLGLCKSKIYRVWNWPIFSSRLAVCNEIVQRLEDGPTILRLEFVYFSACAFA
jgi:hypothetical protein